MLRHHPQTKTANCQMLRHRPPTKRVRCRLDARCSSMQAVGLHLARCTMQASQAALSLHLDAASASCVPWNAIWAAADRKFFPDRGRATPAGCARCCAHAALRTASRAAHASGIFYHFLITGEGGGTVLISWSGSNTSKLSTLSSTCRSLRPFRNAGRRSIFKSASCFSPVHRGGPKGRVACRGTMLMSWGCWGWSDAHIWKGDGYARQLGVSRHTHLVRSQSKPSGRLEYFCELFWPL